MLDHLRSQLQALARAASLIDRGLAEADPASLAALDVAPAVVEADKLTARLDKIREAVAKGRRKANG
jgi:hypothetical protein